MQNKRDYNFIQPMLLMGALALFLSFGVDMTGETLRKPSYIFVVIAILIVIFVFRKSLPRDGVIWTMIGGAFIKVSYILYTAVWTRQHDVISFGAGEGHAAYIEYILAYKKLPDFDPRLIWGFFQPPLHHIISAAWMWINVRLKISERQLQENVQVLTLCYMLVMVLLAYYICLELNMKKRGTLIAMLVVSFHPIFILLSGSINNDALSICLQTLAVYVAIRWYKEPKFITIIILALSISLAMMAKLSAALVAPGIGALMLYKLWIERKNIGKYIAQFVVFGIVVFPIGLWWPIRNKIMWDMPVNYIPEVGEQLTHSSFFSRVLDLRIDRVYPSLIGSGHEYDEYNVFWAMIKTSLFGESDFSKVSNIITPFAGIMLVAFVIIVVCECIAFVNVMFRKESPIEIPYRILLGVTTVVVFAGYLSFALSYNNFSAQDFRYAALVVALMAIILGIYDDRLDSVSYNRAHGNTDFDSVKKNRAAHIYRLVVIASVTVFAICSSIVYLMVGMLS